MSEPTEQPEVQELVAVRVVETEGRSSLVQLDDYRRFYVPASKVKDGQVEQAALDKAVEYGIRWEAFLDLSELDIESLAHALRKAGIWTRDDLQRLDRKLIRIATKFISKAVQDAAHRAETHKLPRRTK